MNARAYRLGVVMVLACSAVAIALRSFAEAAFLSAYGPREMPWLLIANAGGFAAATIGYDWLTRRARASAVDLGLLGALAMAAAAAPALLHAGVPPIVLVIGLSAGSQVAGLALWNRVAASVAGRDARRLLPRAGAAVTAGGAIAGLSAGAVIPRLGLAAIPYAGAAITVVVFVLCIAQERALRGTVSAGAAAPVVPARAPGLVTRRLLVALVAVAALEGVVATVVDLQFIAAVKARYTGDEVAVALALFYGGTNVVLLLLQATAAPHLLLTRSLTFTAAIHPLLVIVSYLWFAASPRFLAIAGTRTCDQVLRLATSRPAQELALSAMPPAPRARWKVLLRGAIWPGGAAAAALVLLELGPSALAHPVRLAGAAIGFALAAALLARVAARRFQVALSAPLGIATRPADDPRRIDLDTLERWTRATGDADARYAALARAALARARVEPAELADHLRHDDPAVRAALFEQLARTPSPPLRGELRTAIAIEDDDDALVAGIHALAILGDRAGIERGKERAGLARAVDDAVQTAELMLGDADVESEIRTLLARDPMRAIALVRARRPADAVVDRVVHAALASTDSRAGDDARACRAGALAVIAAAGTASTLPLLADALTAGDTDALVAIEQLDDDGARLLAGRVDGMEPLARLAIARAAASTPSGVHLISALLDDRDAEVAYTALRSAVALARGGTQVARDRVEAAHESALAAVTAHLDARDTLALVVVDDAACARGELEIATRRCVARLLWATALEAAAAARDPSPIAAVARHLVDGGDAERKRALDVVQELQARPEVLAAIERWLRPPPASAAIATAAAAASAAVPAAAAAADAAAVPGDAAATLAPHDPWLSRLLAGDLAALEPTLRALRRPALFATIAGPALAALARRAERRVVTGTLFQERDSGDTMFVVASGALVARRPGIADRRIGAGEVVGEVALLTRAPRATTVTAEPSAEVLVVDRAAFAEASRRAPELVLGLSATLAGWLAPNRPDAL